MIPGFARSAVAGYFHETAAQKLVLVEGHQRLRRSHSLSIAIGFGTATGRGPGISLEGLAGLGSPHFSLSLVISSNAHCNNSCFPFGLAPWSMTPPFSR